MEEELRPESWRFGAYGRSWSRIWSTGGNEQAPSYHSLNSLTFSGNRRGACC